MAEDNVVNFVAEDEKRELVQAKRRQEAERREADIFSTLAQLEKLPVEKRLMYYRKSVFPLLSQLRPTEQAVSIKRVAKALNIGSKAIKQELKDEYNRDEGGKGALWFDSEGGFIPPVLGDYLLNQHDLVCDRNTIFIYVKGIYRPIGIPFIKSQCLKLMEEEYRDMHGNEIVKYISTKGWNPEPILDTDSRYINLNNGLLDWMADPPALLPHTPEYKSSLRIPVTYNPDATCPRIEQFFRDTCPEDAIDLVYELFGYCMVPDTRFHKAFMLLGDGENGKSTFIQLLEEFIGSENCSAESLQNLEENRFRMASLSGKLVNIYADLPTKRLEETSTFKSLVSGDTQNAERKGEQSFTFKNFARLVFGANKLPRTKDLSHGFFRRWIIIRFPNSFPEGSPKRDPNIMAKITTPEELSGLLNKAVEALIRLYTQKGFTVPPSVAMEVAAYKKENDNVQMFLEECVIISPGNSVSKTHVYDTYKKFCNENGYHPVSSIRFNSQLQTMYVDIRETRVNGLRFWSGINIEQPD